jgi:hypothetical protein
MTAGGMGDERIANDVAMRVWPFASCSAAHSESRSPQKEQISCLWQCCAGSFRLCTAAVFTFASEFGGRQWVKSAVNSQEVRVLAQAHARLT